MVRRNGQAASWKTSWSVKPTCIALSGFDPHLAHWFSLGVSSNGKTAGLQPADEGSTPSHGPLVRSVALSCGSRHWPSEGRLASSTLAWGTVGCLAAPSAGSTKPGWQVRLLHDLLVVMVGMV